MTKTFPALDRLDLEPRRFRMWPWAIAYVALLVLALLTQQHYPGNIIAVTLYKAHLVALGGWGGYWLDRALFPYNRPHHHFAGDIEDGLDLSDAVPPGLVAGTLVTTRAAGECMLRRAIIVAACLVTVGLGA